MNEPRWTKAELEDWSRAWSRTPQTVLHAFIDAGFCSDAEPLREETRLWPKSDSSSGGCAMTATRARRVT